MSELVETFNPPWMPARWTHPEPGELVLCYGKNGGYFLGQWVSGTQYRPQCYYADRNAVAWMKVVEP